MKPLSRQQRCQLDAAEGWLVLGVPREARAELEKFAGENDEHPAVLLMRWQIGAAEGCWRAAHRAAKALCEIAPRSSQAWVIRAETMRSWRGVRAAWNLLKGVVERFPKDAVISYRLACYAAQLGRLEEACRWLLRAFDLEISGRIRLTAILDADLDPLWEELAKQGLFRPARSRRRQTPRNRGSLQALPADNKGHPSV